MQNQNWVDFAAIKRSVELAPLLRHYQVKLRRSGRDQYRGCCPIHGGQGRDAFHANLRKNVFPCFSCGAGGTVLDFVAAMDRCSLHEAALKLPGGTDQPPIPRPTMELLRKKVRFLCRWASPCTASTAGILIWQPVASIELLRSSSASACIEARGSSADGWSFRSTMSVESWSPTVVARWRKVSPATDSLPDSPSRKSCSTSTASWLPGSQRPSWWKVSSAV